MVSISHLQILFQTITFNLLWGNLSFFVALSVWPYARVGQDSLARKQQKLPGQCGLKMSIFKGCWRAIGSHGGGGIAG